MLSTLSDYIIDTQTHAIVHKLSLLNNSNIAFTKSRIISSITTNYNNFNNTVKIKNAENTRHTDVIIGSTQVNKVCNL